MLKYSDDFEAYVLEFEDVIICWDEEPVNNYEEISNDLRKAYNRNIRHIAEAIYAEIEDMFDVTDIDDVISKLGKPQIYPERGQVIYCEHMLDDPHIIDFEYLDDDFQEIENISIDG